MIPLRDPVKESIQDDIDNLDALIREHQKSSELAENNPEEWKIDQYSKYKFDFGGYCRDILGVKLSTQQQEFADVVSKLEKAKYMLHRCHVRKKDPRRLMRPEELEIAHKRIISIQSGMGNGKDGIVAMWLHWKFNCFTPAKCPVTAPKFDQIGDILWQEFKKWNTRVDENDEPYYPDHDDFFVGKDKIYHKGFVKEGTNFAIGRTSGESATNDGKDTKMRGHHTTHLHPIIEEATGVPDHVFKVLFATMTEWGNYMIIIFNPNRTSGFAWETQYGHLMKYTIGLRWNSEESELYDPVQLQIMREAEWPTYPDGKPTNEYRVNVWGIPPTEEAGVLLSWAAIHDALVRNLLQDASRPVILGIDPAGGGSDNFVICIRRGDKVIGFHKVLSQMPTKIKDEICEVIKKWRPTKVVVEIDGIGYTIYNLLRETKYDEILVSFQASGSSREPEHNLNARTDTWLKLQKKFDQGLIDLPNIEQMKQEFKAMATKKAGKGKTAIISKEDLKKILRGKSPDYADSVMISYYVNDEHLEDDYSDRYEDEEEDYDFENDDYGFMVA